MGPAIALFVQTAVFWWRHHGMDDQTYMTYEDEYEEGSSVQGTEQKSLELSDEKKHEL